MRAATQKSRWSSELLLRSGDSGAKLSTGGSVPPKSIRPTLPRITISPSRTNTKASWIKHARRTRRLSNSSPVTRSSNRTTNSLRKSMTARLARTISSLSAVVLTAACTSYYEIPIETPIRPKLDVTAFQRVFVAGFVAGGTEDVDGNLETTRLLRSQLRTKSELRVIDADALPLMEVALDGREAPAATNGDKPSTNGDKPSGPPTIKD